MRVMNTIQGVEFSPSTVKDKPNGRPQAWKGNSGLGEGKGPKVNS